MSVALSTLIHAEWALAATVVMGRTRASARLGITAAPNLMELTRVHLLRTCVSISHLDSELLVMVKRNFRPYIFLVGEFSSKTLPTCHGIFCVVSISYLYSARNEALCS